VASEFQERSKSVFMPKLAISLGSLDTLFVTLCAVIALDTVGQLASYGPQVVTWLVIMCVAFLVPYALVISELGGTFTREGGFYDWLRMAYGRLPAIVGTAFYWVSNPMWVGSSLCFVAAAAWSDHITHLTNGSVGDYAFKIVFIWTVIGLSIVSMKVGKRFINFGTISRLGLVAVFTLTVVTYAISHGVHGFSSAHSFSPTLASFLIMFPLIIYSIEGFENTSAMGGEIDTPQQAVPKAIRRTAGITSLVYVVPILAILLVLPTGKATGLSGFMAAVDATFSVYGPLSGLLSTIMAILLILTLVTEGGVWILGTDRMMAMAGADRAFLPFFGKFHDRLGVPLRMNILSGTVATVFLVASQLITNGSAATTYGIVLNVSVVMVIVTLTAIFPTAIILRRKYPDAPRHFRIPGGTTGLYLAVGVATAFTGLASIEALVPGTLEAITGIKFSFFGNWGVSRERFELLTIGSMAVVFVAIVACYFVANRRSARELQDVAGGLGRAGVGTLTP
jgi:glutamate:GABA antiporter